MEKNQDKKDSVHFCGPETNSVIYFSYLMATSEKYVKEEGEYGDKIQ